MPETLFLAHDYHATDLWEQRACHYWLAWAFSWPTEPRAVLA